MNVLFLTMNVFTDIEMHNIYSDLMKEFIKHGHRPYIVTPREKKLGEKTELINYDDYSLLKVQIGNTSNVSLIEKGISTVTLSSKFYRAIKENLGKIKFDLILYSTPPITLATPVVKLKKLFRCRTYLMLKDIFPQNAVDLEMFSNKSIVYKYFRMQEKKLYKVSDKIGCMSPANVKYILEKNSDINANKVELCPNAIIPNDLQTSENNVEVIKSKYGIPQDRKVFIYGGNLGKPQGIEFLIKCLIAEKDDLNAFFLIVGDGSEYGLIERALLQNQCRNAKLIKKLPKSDYDSLVVACDVGMIFLDHRFTIPNFPSRLLSYMQAGMPVIACTDLSSDIGKIIVDNKFGWWCESECVESFKVIVSEACKANMAEMGSRGFEYLCENYNSCKVYEIIMKKC